MTIEQIAQTCHEVNRAYCVAMGDHSHQPWDQAPQWQKDSAVEGVNAILANPNLTPEQSHQNWFDQKVADGWGFGRVKDATAKTHPCMVPYAALPPEQRAKDYLFGAVVRTLAPHLETVAAT